MSDLFSALMAIGAVVLPLGLAWMLLGRSLKKRSERTRKGRPAGGDG